MGAQFFKTEPEEQGAGMDIIWGSSSCTLRPQAKLPDQSCQEEAEFYMFNLCWHGQGQA